jgi:hypothetical protein
MVLAEGGAEATAGRTTAVIDAEIAELKARIADLERQRLT